MKIIVGKDLSNTDEPTVIVVCVNVRIGPRAVSCGGRESEAIADALETGISARKLDAKVERIRCLGLCAKGPNVRLVPGGSWFNEVTIDDTPTILDHLAN